MYTYFIVTNTKNLKQAPRNFNGLYESFSNYKIIDDAGLQYGVDYFDRFQTLPSAIKAAKMLRNATGQRMYVFEIGSSNYSRIAFDSIDLLTE